MISRIIAPTRPALKAQLSKRTQFYSTLGYWEQFRRIPTSVAPVADPSIKWSKLFLTIICLNLCHQFAPFSVIRHTRVTYKEARVSEWYHCQYGDPIKLQNYKKWEEE